jgi:ferredoxin
MIYIEINRETCSGFGNCVAASDRIFDLDDAGLVVLLHDAVPDDQLADVNQAIYDCPTNSISFTEVRPDGP